MNFFPLPLHDSWYRSNMHATCINIPGVTDAIETIGSRPFTTISPPPNLFDLPFLSSELLDTAFEANLTSNTINSFVLSKSTFETILPKKRLHIGNPKKYSWDGIRIMFRNHSVEDFRLVLTPVGKSRNVSDLGSESNVYYFSDDSNVISNAKITIPTTIAPYFRRVLKQSMESYYYNQGLLTAFDAPNPDPDVEHPFVYGYFIGVRQFIKIFDLFSTVSELKISIVRENSPIMGTTAYKFHLKIEPNILNPHTILFTNELGLPVGASCVIPCPKKCQS